MQPDLLELFPLARLFTERMLKIDPGYGSQRHQRLFVARLHQMQALQPCTKEHEHDGACYSKATSEQAAKDVAGTP